MAIHLLLSMCTVCNKTCSTRLHQRGSTKLKWQQQPKKSITESRFSSANSHFDIACLIMIIASALVFTCRVFNKHCVLHSQHLLQFLPTILAACDTVFVLLLWCTSRFTWRIDHNLRKLSHILHVLCDMAVMAHFLVSGNAWMSMQEQCKCPTPEANLLNNYRQYKTKN